MPRMSVIQSAERIGRLKYAIRNIAASAAEIEATGRKVLRLNIGDPLLYDFHTPRALVEAVTQAMHDGKNWYAPSYGIPAAREAIAASMTKQGAPVAPSSVFVTSGASEAIEAALTAMLEPGDSVLTPTPGYPLYTAILAKLNAEERAYRLDPANHWQPDLAQIESLIGPRTRAIVVINPNNPTGALWGEETLRAILDLARRRGLVVLADEVYHPLTYGPPAPRMASLVDDVPIISLDSMSKAYLATGWRVGWMTLHHASLDGLRTAIQRILDARLCSPTPPQFAIVPALAGGDAHVADAMARLRERRDLVVSRLNAIPGVWCEAPGGAFYIMARVTLPEGRTDEEFVLDVLRTEGVLVVHGSGFGMPAKDGWMRIVYLPPPDVLSAACDAIERTVKRWSK
jgi:alanine-synthesizing transaminase